MTAPRFAAVLSRVTVQDAVHGQIRHALMVGRFDPGQALTINALAEAFGVSHMPVREALKRLAAENALEIASNGSARVPAVSRDRLLDLCRARVALETLAAGLAAPNAGEVEIDALARTLAEHEALGETDTYTMLARNQEFHFGLYALSGSEVLTQLIENLWLRFGPYMRLLTRSIGPDLAGEAGGRFLRHHHDILAGLRAGDVAAVRAAIEADIRASEALLLGLRDPAI